MSSSGPITIYPNTVPGRFVRRLNRFTAEVLIDGILETAVSAGVGINHDHCHVEAADRIEITGI